MANDCTNHLCITGPKKDRDAFIATLKNKGYHMDATKGKFCFHQTVPMPETVYRGGLGMYERNRYPGEKNWYDWSCANWGTKWPNYETTPVKIASKSVKVSFQTAWSPPDKWLENVSKVFPKLKFSNIFSIEGGNGKGRLVAKNGEVEQTR